MLFITHGHNEFINTSPNTNLLKKWTSPTQKHMQLRKVNIGKHTHTHYKETIEGKYSVTEPKGTHILLQS